MIDDIVTRLKDIHNEDFIEQVEIARQAINEIERLRSELSLWKQTAKHVRYHHCKPVGCRYCAIYAEEYPNDPVVE